MNINAKLKRLHQEDIIWIVYFFIIIGALVSNSIERNYYINNNKYDQIKFHNINTIIFIIAFFIYLYYVLINYDDIKTLKRDCTLKEVINTHATFIASLLFLIGGFIFLITEINKSNDDIGII